MPEYYTYLASDATFELNNRVPTDKIKQLEDVDTGVVVRQQF
jgi:hypothetical protein